MALSAEPILFWKPTDPFGEFSNFFPCPVRVFDFDYPTSEHAFQALKFGTTDLIWGWAVRKAPTPRQAAQMGRLIGHPIHPQWDTLRESVMRWVCLAKFSQHPRLASLLQLTDDRLLVEHSPKDFFWGDGCSNGQNRLGHILMEIRGVLRNPQIEASRIWETKVKQTLDEASIRAF